MATEFPIRAPWRQKPPSGVMLDYSGPLMRDLFFLMDGRERFGTQARDFSVNRNHATLSGGTTRNPDGSINYNGASALAAVSGSATAGTFDFLHNDNSVSTISAWCKLDADDPDTLNRVISTFQNNSNSPGVAIYIDDRSGSGLDHVARLFLANGTTSIAATSSDLAFPKDGDWHHICGVIDTTVSASSTCLWLYVDGVEVATGTKDITPSASNAYDDLTIGNRSSNPNEQFKGNVDNVEIYKKAFSADEVAWLSKNRWHAYMPMTGFISSTDPVSGTAHPYYYMRRRYCA